MLNKKISSKLLIISITVLASVALCMCAIIGSSKTAEAKANPSNDFSLTFECEPQYNFIAIYDTWDGKDGSFGYDDGIKKFDYWNYLIENWKKVGADSQINYNESYYKLVEPTVYTGTNNSLVLFVDLYVNLTVGEETLSGEYTIMITPSDGPDQFISLPWTVNGKTVTTEQTALSDSKFDFKAGNIKQNITISGNIVDEAGNGIDGALVSLTPETPANEIPAPVVTINGAFTFEDVDPGILPAMLNVKKDGYTFEPVRITADDVKDGKISLASIVAKAVEEKPATEIAQTGDSTAYLAFALMIVAICGCAIASKKSLVK